MRKETFATLSRTFQFPPPTMAPQKTSAIRLAIIAALLTCGLASMPAPASADIVISVGIAPPALPVYDQPPIPGDGYIWTPGYWSWDDDAQDYYWVPGAWELAPEPGYLWTPGYWGWSDGAYVWNAGYWGPTVGFYGGVCYGFGYTGVGFYGGYWTGGHYYYNRSVTNINNTTVNITNVYNKTVINNNVTNVSYNGGQGGIKAMPTAQEKLAATQNHLQPTALQTQHRQMASQNKSLFSKVNNGKPAVAAVSKPGAFTGPGVVAAKSAGQAHPAAFGNTAAGKQLQNAGAGKQIQNGFNKPGGSNPAFNSEHKATGLNPGHPAADSYHKATGLNPGHPSADSYHKATGFNPGHPSADSYHKATGFNPGHPSADSYHKATGFNPGRPAYNRGPSGHPQNNAAMGKRPPMHFPQGRPQPQRVSKPAPKKNQQR